jgi:predicted DNA-binding antitoxin AbrB/MazE fold protein
MLEVVETVYKNGAFVPEKSFDLPEGTRVKIVIETLEQKFEAKPIIQEPTITDPEERKKALAKLIENMRSNPIPADAPRKFTREELYERS